MGRLETGYVSLVLSPPAGETPSSSMAWGLCAGLGEGPGEDVKEMPAVLLTGQPAWFPGWPCFPPCLWMCEGAPFHPMHSGAILQR